MIGIEFVHGSGKRKTQLQKDIELLCGYAEKKSEYLEHLGKMKHRNSYSKTDTDATFMRMKIVSSAKTAKSCVFVGKKPGKQRMGMKRTSGFIGMKPARDVLISANATRAGADFGSCLIALSSIFCFAFYGDFLSLFFCCAFSWRA